MEFENEKFATHLRAAEGTESEKHGFGTGKNQQRLLQLFPHYIQEYGDITGRGERRLSVLDPSEEAHSDFGGDRFQWSDPFVGAHDARYMPHMVQL